MGQSNVWYPHPASDGGNDLVGICGPHKGFGVLVGVTQEAVDGSLEIDDRAIERKTPRLRRRRVSLAKKPSTALSQGAEVGVK